MARLAVPILMCCLLCSCRYADRVFGAKHSSDCRKWSDAENNGFLGGVKGLGIEQGFAVKRNGRWELDSGTHLIYGFKYSWGPYTYASEATSHDRLLTWKQAIAIDSDYVVHYQKFVGDVETLMSTDTLHWLDTFHAVWKRYWVETDTSIPHRLYSEETYTLDRKCRVTDLVINAYDSGSIAPERRVLRIAPDAPNNHLLSATALDPSTMEVLEWTGNGNPRKVLMHCKECARPCLKVYTYEY